MSTIANLMVQLGMNDSQFTQAAAGAQQAIAKLGSASASASTGMTRSSGIMNVALMAAGAAIVGATVKLAQLGFEAVKVASHMRGMQNMVNVVFGDSAGTISKFAQAAGQQFGIADDAAMQYTGTLGAMFKALDIATPSAVSMSQALTGLAGDMSSLFGISVEEAFGKIQSGMMGMDRPLKEVGIQMSSATLNAYAMSKGIKQSYDQMDEASQTLLRYSYLMQTTEYMQGNFAKTSAGWGAQMKLLAINIDSLRASIGEALIPVLLPLLTGMNNFIQTITAVVNGLKALSPEAQTLVFILVGLVTVVPAVITVVYALSSAYAIYTAIVTVAGVATGSWLTVLLAVVAVIAVLAVGFGVVLPFLQNASKDASKTISGIGGASDAAAKGADNLSKGLNNATSAAKALLSLAGFDEINKLSQSTAGGIKFPEIKIPEVKMPDLTGLADITAAIDNVMKWVNLLTYGLQTAWDSIKTGWEKLGKIFEAVKNNIISSVEAVRVVIAIVLIAAFLKAQSVWDGVVTAWQTVAARVQTVGQGIGNAIKTGLNQGIIAINAFISLLNGIKIKMPAIMGGGTVGFNIPKIGLLELTKVVTQPTGPPIGYQPTPGGNMPGSDHGMWAPKMAAGGIVTSRTLATIGESGREAVLPLEGNTGWQDSLADKIAARMGGGTNVYIGNEKLDGYVVRSSARTALRSNGR